MHLCSVLVTAVPFSLFCQFTYIIIHFLTIFYHSAIFYCQFYPILSVCVLFMPISSNYSYHVYLCSILYIFAPFCPFLFIFILFHSCSVPILSISPILHVLFYFYPFLSHFVNICPILSLIYFFLIFVIINPIQVTTLTSLALIT